MDNHQLKKDLKEITSCLMLKEKMLTEHTRNSKYLIKWWRHALDKRTDKVTMVHMLKLCMYYALIHYVCTFVGSINPAGDFRLW